MIKLISLVILLLVITGKSFFCQQRVIDSLGAKLAGAKGNEKVDLLVILSDTYYYNDTKKAIEYAQEGIALAESVGYKKGLAGAYGSLGFAYIGSDFPKAIENTNKALKIREQIGDTVGISRSLNVLGVIYYFMGNYLLSIEYHLKSIELKEALGNNPLLATSYNNISLVYMAIEDYDVALDYLKKSLAIHNEINTIGKSGLIKTNLGQIYAKMGQYEIAGKYINEALQINKKHGAKLSIADSYNSLASLLVILKEYERGREYYDSALVLFTEMEIKNGIANSENGIAEILRIHEDYDSSIRHAERALKNANEINAPENIFNATNTLYYCYKKKGDFKKALEYLLLNKSVQDTLKNAEKFKKISKIELNLKFEKIRLEKENELRKQKTFNVYLLIILISGAFILFLVIRSSRNKKLANEKLNELNSELNKVNSAKDRFFSIIAHDLRSPFLGLIGLTKIIDDDIDSFSKEELSDVIRIVDKNAKSIYKLLSNLLEWAQIQQGKEIFIPGPVWLGSAVSQNINLLIDRGNKKGIEIVSEIPKTQTVSADESMLNSIIRNLLSNALKFASNGGKIIFKSRESENNMIEISVSDNGIGMSQALVKKLFKLEEKVGRPGTEGEASTGLGLLLCKEFVERHKGKIWVESVEGEGSAFYFTIPAD